MVVFYYDSNKMSIEQFLERNVKVINLLKLESIQECIEYNLEEQIFMKVMPNDKEYIIRRIEFKELLENMIVYFESVEMYEKCSECLELIKAINQI